MGVDFTHCDVHWSYIGFNNARRRLAREIGVSLDEMLGFGLDKHVAREWYTVDDSAIVPLLHHSDCC